MKGQIHLAITLIAITAILAEDHRYCSLGSCPNRTHTLCKFPEARVASRCNKVSVIGLTLEEKMVILNVYNRNRQFVTLYEVEDRPELQSGQLNQRTVRYRVMWDDELAEIAQRWADQCVNEEDECRHVDRFYVRQRVYLARATPYIPLVYPIVYDWFNEDNSPNLRNLNFEGLSINDTVLSASNFLTHLMRQHENKIGCGGIRTYDDYSDYLYLVCNFGILLENQE